MLLRVSLLTLIFFYSTFNSLSFEKQTNNNPLVTNAINRNCQDTISLTVSQYQLNEFLISYVDSGDYSTVEYLLEMGGNPNYSNMYGVTPLMYASDNGYYSIAKLLIDKGADVNYKPSDGNTAIFAAVRSNSDSIAELLLQNKANVNEINSEGLTPLHYAVGYGYPYLTNLLIFYNASLDTKDDYGNTPLMSAVYAGAVESTNILIKSGADVNTADNYGNTPLMVASQFNDTTLIKILFDAGADINAINNKSTNALAIAVNNSSSDAFKLLVKLGAKTDINQGAKSYYQQAFEQKCPQISSFLKENGLSTKLKPSISNFSLYAGLSSSQNDFMADFGVGVYESVSRLQVNVGYKYRPISSRVLVYKNSAFYQFWEKRYSIYLSLNHFYLLKHNFLGGDFGITPGLSNEFTWRYYRGYSAGSGVKLLLVPSMGLFYQGDFITLISKWEFARYNSDITSSNRFSLQLLLTVPTVKRISNKRIDWLD